jgi:hypothetical protein
LGPAFCAGWCGRPNRRDVGPARRYSDEEHEQKSYRTHVSSLDPEDQARNARRGNDVCALCKRRGALPL